MTLENMTQEKWNRLSQQERDSLRSNAGLTPQLIGLEGKRVEVVDQYGNTRRFIVSRSSGWIPCHIEMKPRTSGYGYPAYGPYQSVKVLYTVPSLTPRH